MRIAPPGRFGKIDTYPVKRRVRVRYEGSPGQSRFTAPDRKTGEPVTTAFALDERRLTITFADGEHAVFDIAEKNWRVRHFAHNHKRIDFHYDDGHSRLKGNIRLKPHQTIATLKLRQGRRYRAVYNAMSGQAQASSAFGIYHMHTPQLITDANQQIVWRADRKPFGETTVTIDKIDNPLRFPGQYFDSESGLHYNYFRTYDPSTGRYLEADPIGILFGGNAAPSGGKLNHLYAYVGNNPTRYSDPFGFEPWDWDGQGNTPTCVYYDQQAAQNPNCNYYKEAADICRGKNPWVNSAMAAGLSAGWSTGLQDSQSAVLNNIRDILIWEDMARRQEGATDANQCVCGNDIDRYHDFAFGFSGIPPAFYGGNMWPQGLPPNPVPVDPRNSGDPRNWFR